MQWLEPWEPVGPSEQEADYRRAWETELAREAGPDHALFGLRAILIGRRYDRDDALYRLEDGRVAQVHLTWRGSREIDAHWPETRLYDTLDAWARENLQSDHDEWSAGQ